MTKQVLTTLSLFLISTFSLWAQRTLEGKILSAENNEVVAFASIYIHETKSGVIADENGSFYLQLPDGVYQIELRSVGFQTLRHSLRVDSNIEPLLFKLAPSVIELQDVAVLAKRKGEDPAYRIMRQLLARTPIYERMLDSYSAEVYNKGSMRVDKIPFFLRSMDVGGVQAKDLLGKRFVMESQIDLEYKTPNRYKQHVKAARNSLPKALQDSSDVMSVIAANIYSKQIGIGSMGIMPSPIREGAFSNYRYKLKQTTREGNRVQYLISFKGKDAGAVEGELMVMDSTWSLLYIRLNSKINESLGTYNIEANLNPLHESGLYMPSTYSMALTWNLLGIKFDYQYFSSLSYRSVTPNEQVLAMQNDGKDAELFKANSQVNKRVDYLQSKLDTLGYNVPDKYFVPDYSSITTNSRDSLASKRDSSYWQSVMTVPLGKEERLSYERKDSLDRALEQKARLRIKAPTEAGKRTSRSGLFPQLLFGHDYKVNKNLTLGFDGLFAGALKNYNYADGLWLGQGLFLQYRPNRASLLTLKPSAYYSTKRKLPYWQVDAELQYAPLSRAMLKVYAGHRSDEFISDHSWATSFLNSFSTLHDGRGLLNLTDHRYLGFSNQIDLLPGLRLDLSASYDKHNPLPIERVWGIFKKSDFKNVLSFYATKQDNNDASATIEPYRSFTVESKLTFNPKPYYKIDSYGRKYHVYEGVRAPVFSLAYRQAIPMGRANDSKYSLLSVTAWQLYKPSYSSHLYYKAQANIYLNKDLLNPSDAIQLKAYNTPSIMNARMSTEFLTMPAYSSTYNSNLIVATEYLRSKMLLRFLRYFATKSSDEALHFKGTMDLEKHTNPHNRPYFELGYSIGFFPLYRIGIFYGGYNFVDNKGLAIRLSLNLTSFSIN